MAIDRFTQDQFEAFLTSLEYEILDSRFEGEMVYLLAIDTKARIKIRSTIASDGRARDTDKDSIKLHLEDATGRYLTKMDQDWVNRVHGWDERLKSKMAEMVSLRKAAGDCKKCHKPLQIFTSHTAANPGRRFYKCPDCGSFDWADRYGNPVFFDDHIIVSVLAQEPVDNQFVKAEISPDLKVTVDQQAAGGDISLDDFLDDDDEGIGGKSSLFNNLLGIEPQSNVESEKEPNAEQMKVITADLDKPCRVLAGPGSGKTFCMARRYSFIVEQGVSPDKIVAITFTAKMAEELLKRIKTRYPVSGNAERQICTIHAFCRRLLITTSHIRGDVIVPGTKDDSGKTNEWGWKLRKFLEEALIVEFPDEDLRPLWGETLEWINSAKAHGIRQKDTYDFFIRAFDDTYEARRIARIREKLDAWFADNNLLTFTDMVYMVDILLQDNSEFLGYCKGKFSHIILDEAQDTSSQAVRIIKNIASDRVTFVGDVDQLLYRFNGATPEANLLDGFEKNFPSGQLLFLGTNYRSTSNIVLGSRMILQNYELAGGPYPTDAYNNIIPIREDKGVFNFGSFADPLDEAQEVASVIEQHLAKKGLLAAEDFFIAMRTRAYSVYYEDALSKRKIPFINTTGMSFWLLNHVDRLVSYLRVSVSFKDSTSFAKIYNIPSKNWTCPWKGMDQYGQYMSTRMLARQFLTDYPSWDAALNAHTYGRLDRKFVYGVRDIEDVISTIASSQNTAEAVHYLIEDVFKQYLTFDSGKGTDQDEADGGRIDDLWSVEEMAKLHPDPKEFIAYVDNLIQAARAASKNDWSGRAVIATIHKLKGLERPVVFLVGACEAPEDAMSPQSLLPHTFTFMAPPNSGKLPAGGLGRMEDERCLFYVAVTRAKDEVYVFNPRQYRGRDQVASRFISEAKRALESNER